MLLQASIFAILVAASSASVSISKAHPLVGTGGALSSPVTPFGTVTPVYRCGGVGTQRGLRISGCEGHCFLQPGTVYRGENDFIPSSASPSLSLWVEICFQGMCTIVVRTELPNSSVQPGFLYTAKYDIVPNDILSGNIVEFRAYLYHTDSNLMEICVSADVTIL